MYMCRGGGARATDLFMWKINNIFWDIPIRNDVISVSSHLYLRHQVYYTRQVSLFVKIDEAAKKTTTPYFVFTRNKTPELPPKVRGVIII